MKDVSKLLHVLELDLQEQTLPSAGRKRYDISIRAVFADRTWEQTATLR